jgi:hypothetical protein
MRLPKSRVLRTSWLLLLALVAMVYNQTLEPPTGVLSATELREPPPLERPAQMGAGV